MSVTTLKLVVYYIRQEDQADMQLSTTIDITMRLNELEVMLRSMLLTPRSDDYLALIIPNMSMIRLLEAPDESYVTLLNKSKQKYKLLEDCEYGYGKKGISEKVCLRWLKCSRETIRFLAIPDAFLPVTRHGVVGWSMSGIFSIHFIVVTGIPGEFIELDVEVDPDDDYQDTLVRLISTLSSYDNCCQDFMMDIIKKGKVCSADMPQLYLLPYTPSPLIINLMNLILVNSQGVTGKGIVRLNWRAPYCYVPIRKCFELNKQWCIVVALHQLFHLHDYLKTFNNEHELPLSTMNDSAGKVFQRLHNEGVVAQSLKMDGYYEKLRVIHTMEDEVMNVEAVHDTILRLTEARS
jgi:hypothetical protein